MSTFADLAETYQTELADILARVDEGDADRFCAAVDSAEKVFVAGRGRSGLAAKGFAMRLMHLGLSAHVVDETVTPSIKAADCLVVASGSGRTQSLVTVASQAKKAGAAVLLITAADASPLGGLSDHVLRLPAASPKIPGGGAQLSHFPMASLFEAALTAACDIVVVQLMDRRGQSAEAMFARHSNLE